MYYRLDRRFFLLATALLLVMQTNALAQSQDLRKFEIAGEFSTLERDGFGQQQTEKGGGVRFTFNLNRIIAFETAGCGFPSQPVLTRLL